MSIRVRLIFTLSILLGLMASQVIITVSLISRITDISTEIATKHLTQVEKINDVYNNLILLKTTIPIENTPKTAEILKQIADDISFIEENYNGPAQQLQYFKDYYNEFRNNLEANFFKKTISQPAGAEFQIDSGNYNRLLEQVRLLQVETTEKIKSFTQMNNLVAERTRYLLSAALLLVTVVEIVLGWYLARSISSGLNTLLAATRKVAQGDLNQTITWNAPDEFGHLARSFNAMLRSLQAARLENTNLHKETVAINEERIRLLRERLSQNVRAQEDERQRVARELHDQAGQALTALKLGLAHLQKQTDNDEFINQLEDMKNLVLATMEEIRNLSLDLRPSMLDDLGLIPAIRHYSKQFGKRSDLDIKLNLPEELPRQAGEVEITVFRVIQEALTNIAKHAKASAVVLKMDNVSSQLRVSIQDDGTGFNVKNALRKQGKESIGLFGMRERIELLNGSFFIDSVPGSGTTLEFTIPFFESSLKSS